MGFKNSNNSYLSLDNIIMQNKSYKNILTDYEHCLFTPNKNKIPDINISTCFFIIQKKFTKKQKITIYLQKKRCYFNLLYLLNYIIDLILLFTN